MNSSKNPDFSQSELEALSVWQLPELGGNNPYKKAKEKPEPATPHLTVTEIEAMQKQAYDEAFAQGKAEGFQQGYDQGYDKGYEEGSQKGYDEGLGALNQKVSTFANLMETLSEPFKTLDEEVENELIKLAIAIAAQIIRREIKMDAGQVVAAVREAIKVLPLSSQKTSLHLHPEDAELVRSALSLDDLSPSWAIVEDPIITRGGCKVYTDVSHIDASIENRLAAVIASVFGSERERDRN